LAAVAGVASAGCGRSPDYPPGALRIATGGKGGVYYAYGFGIAAVVRRDLPGLVPEVLATGASVDNLRLVGDRHAEVGFALADSAAAAVAGSDPFTTSLPVVALARLYDNYLHVVVRADGPITDLAGLVGRRVSLGAVGSGTEVISTRLLAAAGIDAARMATSTLGVDESAAGMAAGNLDGFFFSAGLPVAAIAALGRTVPIRLIDVAGPVARLRSDYGEFYTERTIPAPTYGLGKAVSTIGVANYLVVARAMAEPLAYSLTRLLFAQRDALASAHPEARRLDRRTAIDTYPLALHPGAVRYYRAAKE
jgi:TRAP transporter TAXI family solute receptor